jgi:hypothetical protein
MLSASAIHHSIAIIPAHYIHLFKGGFRNPPMEKFGCYRSHEDMRQFVPHFEPLKKVRQSVPHFETLKKVRQSVPHFKTLKKVRQSVPHFETPKKVRKSVPNFETLKKDWRD